MEEGIGKRLVGGMKRRLSLCLRIIVKGRRSCWDFSV
jgi:hypothetical protein